MSTRQEVGVINVKYHCHKATRTPNVTQESSLAEAIVVPSGLIIVDYLFKAQDCFMILMLRSFQFNALSRGNQRRNLPYKKALRDIFWGIQSTSVVIGNAVTLLLESSLLNIDISVTTFTFY